jgi:pyruvate/2-oxoglutarate dehydrogenase complex dihydrolipoamide dehydrogenase (E3) component
MESHLSAFDVVVIGAGYSGRNVARQLKEKNLKTALIALPGNPEDYYRSMLNAITKNSAPVPVYDVELFSGPTKFQSSTSISVGDKTLTAKKFVIASGCVPFIHPRKYTFDNLSDSSLNLWLNPI